MTAFKDRSDEELVEDICNGAEEAFGVLSTRYREKLTAYVTRFGHTREEAQDVVQDAFMKALHGLDGFNREKPFSPWMYAIVRNEAINAAKKKQRRATVALQEHTLDAETEHVHALQVVAHEAWLQRETRAAVDAAIAQLPVHYAETAHLRFIEGRSYQEIATILQKPVSSVGTLVRRARKQLARIVRAEGRMT